MDGWKLKSLKKKSFAKIQELFDKAMKKVNTFVDFRTKLVEESSKKVKTEITQEGSLKKARDDLEQERSKKQKVEDDKESEELKKCLEIIPDDGDDVTIDAIPLSSNKMLKNFDREDLKVHWRLVKARFEKNQQGLVRVKNWKLYDSCGVHYVTMQNILYYLLVKKMYLLTNHILCQMFNLVKLQVDYECEMAYELFRLVKKQLKEGYGMIVGIKSLHEVTAVKVRVTAAKSNLVLFILVVTTARVYYNCYLVMLVYVSTARVKLVLLVKIEENILIQVNAAERLQLLKDKDCLKIKIAYEIRIVIYKIDL
uniref:Uncharacterized protein n=1 Tax=Tanacetum cinerariifolium TaxID=118510 RepID=A0A699HH48_TANCI|nr:hypothetical protein [Tanacetum cinerariifolium]